MRKITVVLSFLACFLFMNCNSSRNTSVSLINYKEVKDSDKLSIYLKNYFKLSEDRDLETWYNTYLNKCTQFYKIEKPTKDSIVNLIKSYWLTSDQQHHDITKIESSNTKSGKDVFINMNYSYNIIATNTKRFIKKLKLHIILNKQNKVLSIKEFSRGI